VKESCVCDHHIYQDVWNPIDNESLQCKRETDNHEDRYAVKVLKDDLIVGHLSQSILRVQFSSEEEGP